ncbi:hypothetical protein MPNT_60142 [Candidatus Methylacidithermus pantelleriae]|uniref:Uncharacterized protein n=1 Tax=Candidatus Methylacidithermus pantelleriae TaxID=2744239 RepID=A0A8J2BL14_9BACT|nr:hypothetical protein MPNT_60142 [Candidatus Methylacidithermus pantelleriae]
MGQTAECWLQDGLADVEGGALASSRRVVADRNGDRVCGGGITRWRGAFPRGRTSADEPAD